MGEKIRFIGTDRHGDYVFALPDGTYCSSPGDAGGLAAATDIIYASYNEGRIVGRAPAAYLIQDGPIIGPDEIITDKGGKLPVFKLPAGADYIMDEPTVDIPALLAEKEKFVKELAQRQLDAWAERVRDHGLLPLGEHDLMGAAMREYEEPLRRRVAEREEKYRTAWAEVFDRLPTEALVEQPVRDRTNRLSAALIDAAVQKVGTSEVITVETQPGVWRSTVESADMIYEIEVRGAAR